MRRSFSSTQRVPRSNNYLKNFEVCREPSTCRKYIPDFRRETSTVASVNGSITEVSMIPPLTSVIRNSCPINSSEKKLTLRNPFSNLKSKEEEEGSSTPTNSSNTAFI